ncbi:3'-5' exonuclease [Shewanella putrefaciens]|jgi:DNA polymerase-3 subunit epsilon|uniref:DNA-directed DNA polymerase n=1 Tax=Shewanella putrefaciens TaxID=24 RepID=A0ABX8XE83_SHEPU|nr:3'-5' exonuclease [Shewanella putrefaciens]CAD6366863.1 DNA polymerase III PolC-type [Shewanella hafniensis]AVV83213.1 DNA polymerase III subunit epsilon [Shewanella putrefaciens]MCT8942469.1 exonuclease domain-containing protein [Shewanella putrefaciens]QSE50497.1 DNA polymerase III subunit epsilon [Shewanella putrefaciens]QYX73907.1 DNA polymerase III subunit epsilon [Shewanella putrefaciens]
MDKMTADFLAKHPFIPIQFIALDAETTGLEAGIDKIIEIAAIKFDLLSNDHPVFEALINPNVKVSRKITSITGITNKMLVDQETFADLAQDLKQFIGDLPIVAYNAKFDKGFLDAEFANVGILLNNHYHCALNLAKAAFNLPNYKLTTVAEHCAIALEDAHRAKADAIAAGRVFMCAAVTLGHINEIKPKTAFTNHKGADHKAYTPNEFGELYGQTIVFTGELSMTRSEAFEAAAELGLEIKSGVSKKTDYLVVGEQDENLVGPNGISSKQMKAEALIDEGFDIQILDEDQFMDLIA